MKYIFLLALTIIFTSCDDKGTTETSLQGIEGNLPEELKGLKIYKVSLGGLDYVRVGVLDNAKTTSTTYRKGKISETFILIEKDNQRTIKVNEIISENDSIIVCRKL
jgi:hypothetical protein